MKTLITLIAAACLVGAAFGQQPNSSPTPGPEHKKLEIWVGDWTYETVAQASPLGPASTYTGKNTARPILNGWFVECRGEDKGPSGTTQYTEIDGYEAAVKRYRWTCFIGDGSVQDFTYTIDGSKVAYSGAVNSGQTLLMAAFLAGALLTILYLFRLFNKVFLGEPKFAHASEGSRVMVFSVALLAAISLGAGVYIYYPSSFVQSAVKQMLGAG